MALLRKIKSATLIEALVATVLIIIVFMVASLTLNNLLLNAFSRNTHAVENRIFELEYQARYNLVALPYNENFGSWKIELQKERRENNLWLNSKAVNTNNKKEVTKKSLCAATR